MANQKTKATEKIGRTKGFKWAYKVVFQNYANDELSSAYVAGKNALIYEVGKETVAKFGGILVFKTLERAQDWNSSTGIGNRILRVKAFDPVPTNVAGPTGFFTDRRSMAAFWNPKSRLAKVHGYAFPAGTLAFRRIIPTKVVN